MWIAHIALILGYAVMVVGGFGVVTFMAYVFWPPAEHRRVFNPDRDKK